MRSRSTRTPPSACTSTTRRCRCWPRASAAQAGCGRTCATTGRSAASAAPAAVLLLLADARRRARRAPARDATPASCRPTPTPASTACSSRAAKPGPIIEAACWAHSRRKFFELARLRKMPIAIEAVQRIDALFAIEREINGKSPAERLAVRQRAIEAAGRQLRDLAARRAQKALLERAARQGDRLPVQPLGRVHALPRRRPHLPVEQRRRARDPRHRRRPPQLDLLRLRHRRPPRRRHVHADRDARSSSDVDPKAWLADVLARIADHPCSASTSCCRGTGRPHQAAQWLLDRRHRPRVAAAEQIAPKVTPTHIRWLPSIALSQGPLSQMHVPRLADQAIDENEAADGPADRLDREIAGSALVHHGQMRREARLPRSLKPAFISACFRASWSLMKPATPSPSPVRTSARCP